ncbi:MAG: hypothetical protein R3E89_05865 [Thiolinea sp.]
MKAEDDPATALHAYICSKIEFSVITRWPRASSAWKS